MSLTKAQLKDIQTLFSKKGRKEKKLFLAEGIRLLEEAARHHFVPQTIYYAPPLLTPRAESLVKAFRVQHVNTIEIPAKQLEAISDAESPQGLVAVFRLPATELNKLYRPEYRRLLLCENIGDPGNLGTLIRSALAFDFPLVITSGATAEPFSPKVVRASAGAVFGLTIAHAAVAEVLALAQGRQLSVLATDLGGHDDRKALRQAVKGRPIILAVGSEAQGLSKEVLTAATVTVRISHSAMVESLNAAVAGSILMKEVYELEK